MDVFANRPARVSVSVQPTLHLLNHELYITSINKKNLPQLTYSLLRLTLKLLDKDQLCRKGHFFSFTETCNDYSLILDSALFKELPDSLMEVVNDVWRPLVIEVGAYGSQDGISKIAASVIGPLADQNISIFCLSTNQEDYVMVKESDVPRVLECLCSRFRLICDSDKQSDATTMEEAVASQRKPPSVTNVQLPSSPDRPIVHPITSSTSHYNICSILPNRVSAISQPLLQLMFYNARSYSKDTFFSVSIVEEDVSLVLKAEDVDLFPTDSIYCSDAVWKLIKIGDCGLGFEECGIVAQVSSPLSQAEIWMYYICTYYNDHALIPVNMVPSALKILNKNSLPNLSSKIS